MSASSDRIRDVQEGSLRLRDGSASLAPVLTALYVAGQLAALRLIDVQPYGVFQHYVPWSGLRETPVALAVLIVQTIACLWLSVSRGALSAMASVPRFLGPLRTTLILAVTGFSLAIPTGSVARSLGEVLLAAWIALVALLNLVLVALVLPDRWLAPFREFTGHRLTIDQDADGVRPWDRWLPWLVAGWVTVACAVLSRFVFDGIPHIDDSVAYYFQAKMLSLGQLQVAAPPDAESFAMTHFVIKGPFWYSKFFPGWPALLSIGVSAGVPWLVNPVLGGVAVLLTHRLILRLYDRATANAAVLLLAASPWLLATSSEIMSHAAALMWALLALLAIEYQRERSVGPWAIIAGVALGALYLTRPFDAALLGCAAALWGWGVGGKRLSIGSLATIAIISLGVASLMFPYNRLLTGSATVPPFQLWADNLFGPGVDVFGFGPNVGIPLWRNIDPLAGHGLADVVLNANKNFTTMNFELFGWAAGSLSLALLACTLGPWRRGDAIMLGIPLIVILGHSFYWAPGGPDLGARYWYLLIVPLTLLTVRGAQMLRSRTGDRGKQARAGTRTGAAILIASASALLCVMPWRSMTKYHRYRDIGGEVRALARENNWDNALVFVRSPFRSDYQSAFNFMSPRLGTGPVFALDAGPAHREAVVRRFPDRPIWIIGPATEDHAGHLTVKVGPLPSGTAPAGEAFPQDRPLHVVLPGQP